MLIKIIYYENEIKGKFMFIKMIKIKMGWYLSIPFEEVYKGQLKK